jgi:GNAT superfamily N-acetyltransferase
MMTVEYVNTLSAPISHRDVLHRWLSMGWWNVTRGFQNVPSELRIDVAPRPEQLQAELADLFHRMSSKGDLLYGMPALDIHLPGFVFRYRQTNGEYYVYVLDLVDERLAGYTMFNRSAELDRRAGRDLRVPHSKYARAYQRRGIASAIYSWWLDAGNCLISGARQSKGAHALWRSLGASYPLICVEVRDKALRYLGNDIDTYIKDDLHTRLVLMGAGLTGAEIATRRDFLMKMSA